MPAYVSNIVRVIASNMPRMMLLMSSKSMPAKMLKKNSSSDGSNVEMDQKAYPIIWLPLRNTFKMTQVLVMLQAMTTRMVLGFFHVMSSGVAVEGYV